MKAIECTQFGGVDLLDYVEKPIPNLHKGEVLIKVMAASANFPDTLMIRNKYQFKPELPFSPGGEVAGTIVEVAQGVTDFSVGDAVFALCGWGGFAEFINVTESKVYPIPDGMDYITAASLMYNYGTSYHALKDRAKLKRSETVLVLGAGGGVGLAAVELAKSMGARVIATASSDEKLEICKRKGADLTINYKKEKDLKNRVKELTQGQGVDVVYDPVGGSYSESAFRAIAWRGRFLVVGFANGTIPTLPLNLTLLKGAAVLGVFWGRFAKEQPRRSAQNLEEITSLYRKGSIKPHIGKYYALKDAPDALEALENRRAIGKLMIVPHGKDQGAKVACSLENSLNRHNISSKKQLLSMVGFSFGTSSWVLIDQPLIDDFAFLTQDQQWIHVLPGRAQNSALGSTIAHGYLSLSLFSYLLSTMYVLSFSDRGINYGINKLRFLRPVKVNARLRIKAKFTSLSERKDGGIKILTEVEAYVEGQEKSVAYAELVAVVY